MSASTCILQGLWKVQVDTHLRIPELFERPIHVAAGRIQSHGLEPRVVLQIPAFVDLSSHLAEEPRSV